MQFLNCLFSSTAPHNINKCLLFQLNQDVQYHMTHECNAKTDCTLSCIHLSLRNGLWAHSHGVVRTNEIARSLNYYTALPLRQYIFSLIRYPNVPLSGCGVNLFLGYTIVTKAHACIRNSTGHETRLQSGNKTSHDTLECFVCLFPVNSRGIVRRTCRGRNQMPTKS